MFAQKQSSESMSVEGRGGSSGSEKREKLMDSRLGWRKRPALERGTFVESLWLFLGGICSAKLAAFIGLHLPAMWVGSSTFWSHWRELPSYGPWLDRLKSHRVSLQGRAIESRSEGGSCPCSGHKLAEQARRSALLWPNSGQAAHYPRPNRWAPLRDE